MDLDFYIRVSGNREKDGPVERMSLIDLENYSGKIDGEKYTAMDLLDTTPIREDEKEYCFYEDDYVYMENAELSKVLFNAINSSVIEHEDRLEMEATARTIINAGAFDHSKYHPYLNYLSEALDIASLGILPIVESFTGRDYITGENLSNSEREGKFIKGTITLALSGTSIASAGMTGGFKQAAIDALAISVSGTGGYLLDVVSTEYLDIPPGASFVISLVGGGIIYELSSKFFLKMGDKIVTITEDMVNGFHPTYERPQVGDFGFTAKAEICFVAGTKISTKQGNVSIEQIKTGDEVLSACSDTKDVTYQPVLEIYHNTTDTLVHVTLENGEEIVSTMRHPYFVKDKGWISAEKLNTTDELLDENWSSIKIQSIVIEELDEPVDTYNFAVAEYHTYFVGKTKILVHNNCGGTGGGFYENTNPLTDEMKKILGDRKILGDCDWINVESLGSLDDYVKYNNWRNGVDSGISMAEVQKSLYLEQYMPGSYYLSNEAKLGIQKVDNYVALQDVNYSEYIDLCKRNGTWSAYEQNISAGGYQGGTKSDILAQNRANGRAFEQQEFAKFSSQNKNAVEQITVKTSSGVKTRVDAIGLDSNGNVVINEFKSSLTAPLTDNQKLAFPEIFESGATVVGKGKGIFTGGYQIPSGTKVTIIRPE